MSGNGGAPPEARAELMRLLRRLGETTGKKAQYRQAAALGVPRSSWSRYLKGGVPREDALISILARARVPEHEQVGYLSARRAAEVDGRRMAREHSARPESAEQDDVDRSPRTPPVDQPGMRRLWLRAGAVFVACAGLAAIVVVVLTNREVEKTPEVCDQYVVTAETLARRSSDGSVTGEYFTTGEILDVRRRSGSADGRFWYVVSGDGRAAWVLPSTEWWRPNC